MDTENITDEEIISIALESPWFKRYAIRLKRERLGGFNPAPVVWLYEDKFKYLSHERVTMSSTDCGEVKVYVITRRLYANFFNDDGVLVGSGKFYDLTPHHSCEKTIERVPEESMPMSIEEWKAERLQYLNWQLKETEKLND